jgi:hypothetical protein
MANVLSEGERGESVEQRRRGKEKFGLIKMYAHTQISFVSGDVVGGGRAH